jgi:DNA-binding MarR family transcriptional regulator
MSGSVRNTDPVTSLWAAESIDATHLESEVLRVLGHLGQQGGTAEEIADRLNLRLNTVSPRTAPLERKGKIICTGYARPGVSGRKQLVWALPEFKEYWDKRAQDEERQLQEDCTA